MKASKGQGIKITPGLKKKIIEIVDERIREAHVTREDFSELKAIVRELAEAQKKTEEKLADLTEEVRKLAHGLNRTREDLGGLARSFSYAFENEAYRMLPGVLTRYGIEVDEKIVRAEVGGKEINFFGKARKNGREVFIVGEVKLRLDDTEKREDAFGELEEKVEVVRKEYGDVEVVRLLVAHFATKGFLKKAEKRGVIVVQSYEW
jgi:predicted house-cleaning noncanonical NTP pyrophosphatase (MazG superfamily)